LPLNENFLSLSLPLPGIPQEKRSHDSSRYTNTTEYGNAHESFPGNLVVDERAQVRGLQVGGLLVEQEVVVAAGFAVVAELVVAEGEVVEAFPTALWGDTEDIREQADAELLVISLVGLDETLSKERKKSMLVLLAEKE
jgi:hypothetical protein